jgi:acetoacetyl-CoA synthetase
MIIYGRSDATLTLDGVRISTAEIYRQVETLDEITYSLVIGQDWDSDVRVVLFVKLNEGVVLDESLVKKIKDAIRNSTTPRHVPAKVIAVADVPYTLNGKKEELAVRNVIHGKPALNKDALLNPLHTGTLHIICLRQRLCSSYKQLFRYVWVGGDDSRLETLADVDLS